MPHFLEEVRQITGKSTLNIYILLITKLSQYAIKNRHDSQFILAVISDVKILFHNHEQQWDVLVGILKKHLQLNIGISEDLALFIQHVIETLDDISSHNDTTLNRASAHDNQCRMARFFESSLAIQLLQKPSSATWKVVNRISAEIIAFIEMHANPALYRQFLIDMGPDLEDPDAPHLELAFGRFAQTPKLEEIIATLAMQNNLARIMLIHFMFMRDVYPYCAPDIKALKHIKRAGYSGALGKYMAITKGQDFSAFFFDYTAFPLYQDRGRGDFKATLSQQLGICLLPEDRAECPSFDTAWCPDSICQVPDPLSIYTQSLILHDIPYVAGPSGMTTLLCAAMLFLGKFEASAEKNHYILAIIAFITGGGLHSMHEVLTVPHVRLGLLENYKPFGKGAGNYNDFFELFQHDTVVMANIEAAWDITIAFFCKKYPQLVSISAHVTESQSPVSCCFV